MIKSELVQIIAARNPHLFLRDVENIVGAIFDAALEGRFRVSVVATGLRQKAQVIEFEQRLA